MKKLTFYKIHDERGSVTYRFYERDARIVLELLDEGNFVRVRNQDGEEVLVYFWIYLVKPHRSSWMTVDKFKGRLRQQGYKLKEGNKFGSRYKAGPYRCLKLIENEERRKARKAAQAMRKHWSLTESTTPMPARECSA